MVSRLRFALVLLLAAGSALAQPVPGAIGGQADGARAEAAYDAARALFDAGLYGPAAQAFATFRADYPRDVHTPQALYYQAESALASGNDAAASGLFRQFGERYPSHPFATRARLALGRYYWATGDWDNAEVALTDALAQPLPAEDLAEAGYLLGLVYGEQDRPGPAVQAFLRAAEVDTPVAPQALYAAALTQLDRQDWRGAVEVLGTLDRRYPDAPENTDAGLARAEAYARLNDWQAVADEAGTRRRRLSGSDLARADLLQGEALVRLGQLDEAQTAFERVPDSSRYDRRATFGRARISYDRGNYELAASLFDAVMTGAPGGVLDPLAHEATYYTGLSLKRLGQLGEAERLLQEASLQEGGAYVGEAMLELGLLLYERRRYEEAASVFATLARDHPDEPFVGEAARMEGESYAALGRVSDARDAYERAERLGAATAETRSEIAFQDAYGRFRAGNYAAAIPALLTVAETNPGGPRSGEALFWAGEAAFQLEQYARAEEILRDFVERHPTHPRADAARYALAYTHFRRRDYGAAASAFERFLSAYTGTDSSVPYRPDALFRLADSYFALERFADARAVYQRAYEAAPGGQGQDYALYQIAQAHAASGNTDAAIATYGRLAREVPSSDLVDEALYSQGALLLQSGRDAEAADLFARAANARPGSPLAARARVGQGDALYNAGDYEGAERAYRQVLERSSESDFAADALEGLGYALDAMGRASEFEAAVLRFERTTTNPLARARVQIRRAEVALEAGDYALAAERIDALLAVDPPAEIEPRALLLQAEAYTGMSEYNAAASALRRLVETYGSDPLAPEAALRLAELRLNSEAPNQALLEAQRFQTRFPDDAERVAAALLIEARALDLLDRPAEADQRLGTLASRYPDSTAADDARRRFPTRMPARPDADG
ncbi:MAG TPA: tetratricopeptide repeat protein [Bacteroidetes bacterium]|nr:tetratricopeptide repeat protein [Bacteroidota bacterium]